MTLAATSDANTRAELWGSFASLLRAYATVEATATRRIAVESIKDSIAVCSGGSSMRLSMNMADGGGTLSFSPEGEKSISEPVELRLDGTIQIGESSESLDLAAIDLLRRFGAALQRAEDLTLATLAVMVAVV